LKNVKNSSKGWGINLRWSQLKRKKEVILGLQDLEIMEEMRGLTGEDLACRAAWQKEILDSYEVDELYWYSRSSENS
jgi:hypothetical protein